MMRRWVLAEEVPCGGRGCGFGSVWRKIKLQHGQRGQEARSRRPGAGGQRQEARDPGRGASELASRQPRDCRGHERRSGGGRAGGRGRTRGRWRQGQQGNRNCAWWRHTLFGSWPGAARCNPRSRTVPCALCCSLRLTAGLQAAMIGPAWRLAGAPATRPPVLQPGLPDMRRPSSSAPTSARPDRRLHPMALYVITLSATPSSAPGPAHLHASGGGCALRARQPAPHFAGTGGARRDRVRPRGRVSVRAQRPPSPGRQRRRQRSTLGPR